MKRTLTSIAAAALVLGAMTPAAFAASTANTAAKVVGTKAVVVDGTTLSNPYELTAVDSGNTTAYFGIYYFNQALTKAGFTASWDGTNHIWNITAPGVDASTIKFDSTGQLGSGNTTIKVNGTVVKYINTFSHKDPAGSSDTTYFPVYYVNNLLTALGAGGSWDAANGLTVKSPVKAAAVASVKGLNATQVEVDFTTPVDATDAAVVGRYGLNGVTPASVAVADDGLSATLTFASADSVQVTNGAFVVNPIKTAADATVSTKTYAGLFTFADTTAPSISSASSVTNTNYASSVTVNFSEPIKSLGTVKIDGVVAAPTGFAAGDSSATFNGQNLSTASSHTVQFIGLKDQADNVVANTTYTFNVTKDTTAPVASLSTQGDHTIIVTFSKKMNPATVTAALAASSNAVKDELLGNIGYSDATVVSGSNNTKYAITITSALYTNKTSRTLSVVFPASVTDYLGNPMAASSQQVTLTKDTVKPAITGVSYKTNSDGKVTDILVNVSEGVAGGTITPTNSTLTIVDQNGVLYDASTFLGGLSATATAGDKQLDFVATTPAALTGKYFFTFASGFVSDTAQTANTNDSVNYAVDFGSPTASTSFTYSSVDSTTTHDVFKVDYGTAVKGGAVSGSATDVSNYTLNGTALPAGTTIYLDGTQKIATITLPSGSIKANDSAAVFTINNVQSLTGATVKPVTTTVNVYDNTKPTLNFASLNSDQTLTVGFDEALNTAPVIGDFVVNVNGSPLTLTGLAVNAGTGLNAGKYVIDLSSRVLYDATHGTFLDMDGSGAWTAGDLVLNSTTDVHSTINLLTAPAVTSFTVGTKASGITAADAQGNTATASTTVVVK